jgi:hypothetical protein
MKVLIPEGGIKVDGITWPAGEREVGGRLANKLFPLGATLVSREGLEGIEPAASGIGAGTSSVQQEKAQEAATKERKKKDAPRKSRSA